MLHILHACYFFILLGLLTGLFLVYIGTEEKQTRSTFSQVLTRLRFYPDIEEEEAKSPSAKFVSSAQQANLGKYGMIQYSTCSLSPFPCTFYLAYLSIYISLFFIPRRR